MSEPCTQGVRIAEISKDVETLRNEIISMKHYLHGNGQPGKLKEMEKELKAISDKLTNMTVGLAALVAAAGMLAGAGGSAVLKFFI